MTPGGLRAQYLIPNLSPKCECLSTNSSLPLGPRHHAIPRNQRKQSPCQTEANCRPQVPLLNPFEGTFLLWTGFFLPSWAHESDSLLYQILVLIVACFRFWQDLVDEVDWSLDRVGVAVFLPLDNDGRTDHVSIEMATGRNPSGSVVPYPHPPTLTPTR
jgi:hypothetical protein